MAEHASEKHFFWQRYKLFRKGGPRALPELVTMLRSSEVVLYLFCNEMVIINIYCFHLNRPRKSLLWVTFTPHHMYRYDTLGLCALISYCTDSQLLQYHDPS